MIAFEHESIIGFCFGSFQTGFKYLGFSQYQGHCKSRMLYHKKSSTLVTAETVEVQPPGVSKTSKQQVLAKSSDFVYSVSRSKLIQFLVISFVVVAFPGKQMQSIDRPIKHRQILNHFSFLHDRALLHHSFRIQTEF